MRRGWGTVVGVLAGMAGLGLVQPSGVGSDVIVAVALLALVAASAVAAASVRQLIVALVALLRGSSTPRPHQRPGLALSIVQSVPDAPGKPLARAPGRFLAVA